MDSENSVNTNYPFFPPVDENRQALRETLTYPGSGNRESLRDTPQKLVYANNLHCPPADKNMQAFRETIHNPVHVDNLPCLLVGPVLANNPPFLPVVGSF